MTFYIHARVLFSIDNCIPMNRRSTLLLLSFVAGFGLLLAAGCDSAGSSMNDETSDTEDPNTSDGPTTLQMHLTDEPGDVVKAEVLITSVSIVSEEDTSQEDSTDTGISALREDNFRVDLTKLQGGVDTLMSELTIDSSMAGTYSQVRLITAHPDSFDVTYETSEGDTAQADLFIPSGSQTGIKVNLDPPVDLGTGLDSVDVTLDFSVEDSFVPRGREGQTSDYNFKPTVTATVDSSNAGS